MYKVIAVIVRFFVRLLWGLEVEGLENIPPTGGAVVASNHNTWFDPVVIAITFKRPVHFMAKAELFKNPILAWLLRKVYAFPVRRGLADRNAIRTAQERVKAGCLLGIFPEGTRNWGAAEFLPLQGGAALIALKTGVPVIPVITTGVDSLRWRQPMRIVIGAPLDLGGPQRANKLAVNKASTTISQQFSVLISRNN